MSASTPAERFLQRMRVDSADVKKAIKKADQTLADLASGSRAP
jgi:hypothetical protein